MALKRLTDPACAPVSLAEARKHLVIDASDRSSDSLINMLIESATADAQMKTGRVWVDSEWEWVPDLGIGVFTSFPIVPVTEVMLYDLTPKPEEPIEPEPEPEPEPSPEPEPEGPGEDNEPESREGEEAAESENEKPEEPDQDLPTNPAPNPAEEAGPDSPSDDGLVNIASEYLEIEYPSPDPMGSPAIGGITLLKALPDKFQLVLKAGYPVKESLIPVEQNSNPSLALSKTAYLANICRLVFDRPVEGQVGERNFEFRINGEMITIIGAEVADGVVSLTFEDGALVEGAEAEVSFFEGDIHDEFGNFVQPIVQVHLPVVKFSEPEDLPEPDPVPCEVHYESDCPVPVKNWILTRVGSLYTQRTEIALRAGKSNDAMFPEQFVNNLLNPYRVRWL